MKKKNVNIVKSWRLNQKMIYVPLFDPAPQLTTVARRTHYSRRITFNGNNEFA